MSAEPASPKGPSLHCASAWPDLVFHVLAHVRASAHLPASVYDPSYVQYAEHHLGPAAERPLAEDAAILGQLSQSHDALVRLQLLAWLFRSDEDARPSAPRDLSELTAAEGADAALLAELSAAGPAVELLRCAAELERPVHALLPPLPCDEQAVAQALAHAVAVAPWLGGAAVTLVRSLRLRGRVRGRDIWVGVPSAALGLELAHVIWQASHEATVAECTAQHAELGLALHSRAIEQVAVVLLGERSQSLGRHAEHARWLAHFGDHAPSLARASLRQTERSLLEACLGRPR